jgi:RNA polymerase sigma factor (sigma-70 family)
MLVRTFLDEKRLRWSKVRLLGELPTDLAARPGPDTETRLALREALVQVPPRQRAALVLRFYCDLSVEQTADVLGCATGTVKSQTAHGLSALRRLLSVPAPTPAN